MLRPDEGQSQATEACVEAQTSIWKKERRETAKSDAEALKLVQEARVWNYLEWADRGHWHIYFSAIRNI